jgi:polyhydroxyalkanoate synthesis regulator phasin
MTDIMSVVKKTMMTGIGLALKTKDEVEDWARDLVTRGEISENEGEKFVDELLKRYDEAREDLEKRIEKVTKEIMKKARVASMDELESLKKEIEELRKENARLSGSGE